MDASVSTTLKACSRLDALCTSSYVQLSDNGEYLVMQSADSLHFLNPITGLSLRPALSIVDSEEQGSEEAAASLAAWCQYAADVTVTINSRGLFEAWGEDGKRLRSWRGPSSPLTCQPKAFLLESTLLLATGHADHSIRIWDVRAGHGTHILRGHHGGLIRSLVWNRDARLFSAAEDGTIASWDICQARDPKNVKPHATLIGHLSSVPSLAISPDGRWLVSGGRDQVLMVWDASGARGKQKAVSVIPAGCPVSAVEWLHTEHLVILAGLSGGAVGRWQLDSKTGIPSERLSSSASLTSGADHEIIQLVAKAGHVHALTSEHDLVRLDSSSMQPLDRLVGGSGEVTDLAMLDSGSGRVAVAGNRPIIRIHAQSPTQSMACQHWLQGHEAAVLCLAWLADDNDDGRGWLVSGSRDHTVRVWRCEKGYEKWRELACLTGHTDAVSSVAIGRESDRILIASAGADCTLKLWEVDLQGKTRCRWTVRAHEKEINQCVLMKSSLWTAGQDRLAKEWSLVDGKMKRQLKGHRRGVWSVAVLNNAIATGSADGTVRLWPLDSEVEECFATLEGHTGSVLRVSAYGEGQEVLSAGADGLVKIWNATKDSNGKRCIATFDQHADRIWALSRGAGPVVAITGDAAGSLVWWEDATEEAKREVMLRKEKQVLAEQELSNLLMRKDHAKAIRLAIQLDQPQRLYSLLCLYSSSAPSLEEAVLGVEKILRESCEPAQLVSILGYLRAWNATMRRALGAQIILRACLQICRPTLDGNLDDDFGRSLSELMPQLQDYLRALLPYTERHYNRIDEMQVDAALMDFFVEANKNA